MSASGSRRKSSRSIWMPVEKSRPETAHLTTITPIACSPRPQVCARLRDSSKIAALASPRRIRRAPSDSGSVAVVVHCASALHKSEQACACSCSARARPAHDALQLSRRDAPGLVTLKRVSDPNRHWSRLKAILSPPAICGRLGATSRRKIGVSRRGNQQGEAMMLARVADAPFPRNFAHLGRSTAPAFWVLQRVGHHSCSFARR